MTAFIIYRTITECPVDVLKLAIPIYGQQLIFIPVGLPACFYTIYDRFDKGPYFLPAFLSTPSKGSGVLPVIAETRPIGIVIKLY
jgi:hypothetical protein